MFYCFQFLRIWTSLCGGLAYGIPGDKHSKFKFLFFFSLSFEDYRPAFEVGLHMGFLKTNIKSFQSFYFCLSKYSGIGPAVEVSIHMGSLKTTIFEGDVFIIIRPQCYEERAIILKNNCWVFWTCLWKRSFGCFCNTYKSESESVHRNRKCENKNEKCENEKEKKKKLPLKA